MLVWLFVAYLCFEFRVLVAYCLFWGLVICFVFVFCFDFKVCAYCCYTCLILGFCCFLSCWCLVCMFCCVVVFGYITVFADSALGMDLVCCFCLGFTQFGGFCVAYLVQIGFTIFCCRFNSGFLNYDFAFDIYYQMVFGCLLALGFECLFIALRLEAILQMLVVCLFYV